MNGPGKALTLILALAACLAWSPARAADQGPRCPLPDLSEWELVSEQRRDQTKDLAGEESVLREFRKGDKTLFVNYIQGRPAAYWYRDAASNKVYGLRGDFEGDGHFEQADDEPREAPSEIRLSPKVYGFTYRSEPRAQTADQGPPQEITLFSF